MKSSIATHGMKTLTHASSALTLGLLLAGQAAFAAPFSYEFTSTIADRHGERSEGG